jgi:hypothetical protein
MMFGLPGIAIFIHLIVRARTRLNKDDILLLSIVLFYGSTLQGFATSSYCTVLGMLLMGSHLYRSTTPVRGIQRFGRHRIVPKQSMAHDPLLAE